MKNMIADLWHSLKKSPFLFLFVFIQIVITSLILYSVLATYYWTEEQSAKAQITWGNKEYLKILSYMAAPQEKVLPIISSMPNRGKTEYEKNQNLITFFNIDKLYDEIKDDPDITILTCQNFFSIALDDPKNWKSEDRVKGEFGLFDVNDSDYSLVHTCIVSSNYLDYFGINLSEGEYFKENDYLYEGDYIPVLMGSVYKQYYSVGEEFEGKLYNVKTKFKVIGFIAENQYFTTAAEHTAICKYDNYIVVPYIEKDLEGCMAANRTNLFTSRFVASFFVCEPQKLDETRERVDSILEQYGFSDLFYTFRCRIEKELSENYADQLFISIAVCIATFLFSLFSFIFTMLYKIGINMKSYAIRIVVGETYGEIAFRYLFESFVFFLLGQFTGFFLFKIYSVHSFIYQGYDYLEASTLRTGILLNAIFFVITAIVLYICINVKLKTYSLATLIRGTEVKKENRMPFYRVVIFFMLAIVGVFGMFIASYQVSLDRIDLYYTGYFTKNAKAAQANTLADPEIPKVIIDLDMISEMVDNIVINRYVSMRYRGDDLITERGIYFNGYIDPVNMLEGRFFTPEESSGKEKIAVVGKEIYNKYVTFDESGNAHYYCEDLETDFLVMGVMGKEEQATALDYLVFLPLKLVNKKLGDHGIYMLDGANKRTVDKLEEVFIEHASMTSNASSYKYTPRITVEAPTDTLLMLLLLIIINAVVFCFYYVSKQGHIHAVKKIVGYSKTMIISDTFADFLVLTLGAFVTGNTLVILLKETVFRNVQLFSIYMLDPQVIVMTLIAVVLLTVFLSVIAVTKTFTAGNSNEYRA